MFRKRTIMVLAASLWLSASMVCNGQMIEPDKATITVTPSVIVLKTAKDVGHVTIHGDKDVPLAWVGYSLLGEYLEADNKNGHPVCTQVEAGADCVLSIRFRPRYKALPPKVNGAVLIVYEGTNPVAKVNIKWR